MPRGDQTGPWGAGPMTGRAVGYCAGTGAPGYTSVGPGGGFRMGAGRGRGFGGGVRGWGNRWCAAGPQAAMRYGWAYGPYAYPADPPKPDPEWERGVLKGQAETLRRQLDRIEKRISEMEAAGTAD